MSRNWVFSLLMGALLSGSAVVWAQEPPSDAPPPPHGDMMPGRGPLGPRMEILGFEEMHPGKVVTGAPYSATAVIQTTQTLSDGTNINRKVQSNVYRDSQGRVRREMTLPAIGPLASGGQTKSFVLIHDPVAGTAYELRPDTKTATQLPARPGKKNSDTLQNKFEARIQEEIANGSLKKEDLGTQTISGIAAQGTRYTRTIAAGQIGNDKPISVVEERWYSPDLQIVVKSTRTDPRVGTRTYLVTNVQRQEQAASLFAVPSDYTVTQARGPRGGHRGAGPAAGGPPADAPPAE